MARLIRPFFRSSSKDTEATYTQGVLALQQERHDEAFRLFSKAADEGHISANFNLGMLVCSGHVSPYDIDLGIQHFLTAAKAGHPRAKEVENILKSIGLGLYPVQSNFLGQLSRFIPEVLLSSPGLVNPNAIIFGTQLFNRFCRSEEARDAVIAAELDAASKSDWPAIHRFIKRSGIPPSFYEDGMDRMIHNQPGSLADLITDRLLEFNFALLNAGTTLEIGAFVRCTIVGYLIEKSRHAANAQPLLGVKEFWG